MKHTSWLAILVLFMAGVATGVGLLGIIYSQFHVLNEQQFTQALDHAEWIGRSKVLDSILYPRHTIIIHDNVFDSIKPEHQDTFIIHYSRAHGDSDTILYLCK